MDSAAWEISSVVAAQAFTGSRAKPPNAIATPAIACRLLDGFESLAKLVPSFMDDLRVFGIRHLGMETSSKNIFKIIIRKTVRLSGRILHEQKTQMGQCPTPPAIVTPKRKTLLAAPTPPECYDPASQSGIASLIQ